MYAAFNHTADWVIFTSAWPARVGETTAANPQLRNRRSVDGDEFDGEDEVGGGRDLASSVLAVAESPGDLGASNLAGAHAFDRVNEAPWQVGVAQGKGEIALACFGRVVDLDAAGAAIEAGGETDGDGVFEGGRGRFGGPSADGERQR